MSEKQEITKKESLGLKNSNFVLFISFAFVFLYSGVIYAQPAEKEKILLSFPAAFNKLNSDTARMKFLVKAISDSLNEGQLTHVLHWSRIGLQMAEKNKIDTLKGIFLFDIGKAFAYKYSKYDSAIYYYKKSISFFPDQLHFYNIISVREIMDRYADLGNKDSSFYYLDLLKTRIDTMPDAVPRKIALSQNIATVYQWFGMYRSAIRYYQTAINGNRINNNFRGLGLALANLGLLYNEMEDNSKAIQFSKEALIYLSEISMPFSQTAANLADFYISNKQYDSAYRYLNMSDERLKQINDSAQILINQSILARIFIAQKKYLLAGEILENVVDQQMKRDDSWNLCRTILNYVDLDTSLHQYNSAIKNLNQVLDISLKNGFQIITVTALQNLAAVYTKTGNYKEANQYRLNYINLKDSIANAKSKTDLNDLEISYGVLQKEQEINLLRKDNDIAGIKLQNTKRSLIFYITGFCMLLTIFGFFFYQRNQRLKLEAQKQKAELEMQVLRSQMNPHFIFNSLNSIENFMMQNEKRLASDYLNKFSRLIRSILDSSRNELIPLAKDMEALQLYVDLEQLRFNNKFRYQTYIDPQLIQGDYRVPSLLIQPYVENAIVHGIAHSTGENLQLTVTAVLENETIRYTIQDNGVGRKQASEYKQQNKPNHKSVGLKITEDRIAHFNNTSEVNDAVEFTDLYDEWNEPAGTKVAVKIKTI